MILPLTATAMDTVEQKPRPYRFGVFELDVRVGELRKYGVRLKLQQQPLEVLVILLERAGDVVTREDIQKRLWPDNTFVGFDTAINNSIRKLRDALSDSADSPRFIETLPRRGYRFIAPISQVTPAPGSVPEALPGSGSVAPASSESEDLGGVSKEGRSRRTWRIASGTAALVVLAASLAFWILKSRSVASSQLNAVPLTSYPGWELLASFSPEGTRVAFCWQRPESKYPEVFVKLLGAGEPVQISSAGGIGPAWSADGRFIAFLRPTDDWHAAVMVIPTLGGQERELARTTFVSSLISERSGWNIPSPFLAWSRDGRWLLTLDQKSPGKSQPHAIARISVETGEKRLLTSPSSATLGDGGLALSPDGKRLAFTRDSGFWARDIYVVPVSPELLSSAKPERLTFDNKAIAGLAWTGDGKQLVFASPRDGRPSLWKIGAERRSHPMRLNLTDEEFADVAISGRGNHLLYSHKMTGQNIWRASVNRERPAEAKSFIASTRRDTQGVYSPDGKRIVFESSRSGNEEIWVCEADGSHPLQLTHFGNAWAGCPKWSPDGATVTFASNASGKWDIYLVGSSGGKPRRLTNGGADHSWPSWSQDGNWIYYFSNRGKRGQIWKMRLSGGGETQVTRNGGLRSNESPDGKELYYTNELGLWRLPTGGGDEVKIGPSYVFAVRNNGIYYVPGSPQSGQSSFPLAFLDFKTHQARTAGILPGPLGWNIDVSPDERWVIYGKFDREGSELMLVENFP